MYEFHLKVYDRAGTLVRSYVKPLTLTVSLGLYGGAISWTLNADDPIVSDFQDLALVEAWWRNLEKGIQGPDGSFTRLADGIFREYGLATDDNLKTAWTGKAPSAWDLLDWRQALYPAKLAGKSYYQSIPTETIGKQVVNQNLTGLATTLNGRWRNGDLSPMGYQVTVATDQGRGTAREKEVVGRSIMRFIQDLGRAGDGDFTLTRVGDTMVWDFDFQVAPVLTDVIFSLDRKNMVRPTLSYVSIGRGTVVTVGGEGKDSARLVAVATGPDYAADNDREAWLDARELTTIPGLAAEGAEYLHRNRSRGVLDFQVAQTSDTFFSTVPVTGRNTYTVGDVVTAEYFGSYQKQVTGVSIRWEGLVPDIQVDLEDA